MSQQRKRLSGAEYRKISHEKKRKEEELLAKTLKIRDFFRVETTPLLSSTEPLTPGDTDGEPPASVIVTAETATEQSAVAVEEPNAGIKSAVEGRLLSHSDHRMIPSNGK